MSQTPTRRSLRNLDKECCTGSLDPLWAGTPVDFHRFRERLAVQMLEYSPKHLKYKGDEKFRVNTQLPKAKRRRKTSQHGASSGGSISSYTTTHGIDKGILESGGSGRVCGFLSELAVVVEFVDS